MAKAKGRYSEVVGVLKFEIGVRKGWVEEAEECDETDVKQVSIDDYNRQIKQLQSAIELLQAIQDKEGIITKWALKIADIWSAEYSEVVAEELYDLLIAPKKEENKINTRRQGR